VKRRSCETCGQKNVAHDGYGLPHLSHSRGKRHQDAIALLVAREAHAEHVRRHPDAGASGPAPAEAPAQHERSAAAVRGAIAELLHGEVAAETWAGKKLDLRTSRACHDPQMVLGSPEGERQINGFFTTAELLIGEHITFMVAATADKQKARESIEALLAHINEEAERIAKWATAQPTEHPEIARHMVDGARST
jgi:hypothetical protein